MTALNKLERPMAEGRLSGKHSLYMRGLLMSTPEVNKEQTQMQMAKLTKSNANVIPIKAADAPIPMTVYIIFLECRNAFLIHALSPRKP